MLEAVLAGTRTDGSAADLQALHIEALEPAPSPLTPSAPQAAVSRESNMVPEPAVRSSLQFLQDNTTSSRQQTPATRNEFDDLTAEDLIALIGYHRGNTDGLANLGRGRLQVLLKHHEV